MKMNYKCEHAKETRERIECKLLKGLCIHQYYKMCKGRYELTAFSQECGVKDKYEKE